MTDLTTMAYADSGWWAQGANAINNQGQIVGGGTHFGNPRAWLMDPLPIPDLSLLAWALSLIGLASGKQTEEPTLNASARNQSIVPPNAEGHDLPPAFSEAIMELVNKAPILTDPAAHHEVSETLLELLEQQIRALRQSVESTRSRS
jgi:hypothetical protein